MKMQKILMMFTLLLIVRSAAAVDVFACEPEWAALAQELGGDRVEVFTASAALQDPHRIEARPTLIAKLRQADLLVCTGADLETGWLPMLLRKASNDRVQPGKPGHFLAAQHVPLKEIPARLDRAEGDVHAFGNPHIQTDPRNIAKVAQALAQRLAQIDASQSAFYAERHQAFAARWQAAMQRWEQQAAPLRSVPVVVQHKSWVYLQDWLGLVEVATLEPKPGIPPSSGYLAEVLTQLHRQPARMVIRAAYQDGRSSEWLSKQAGIPAVELPFTVGGNDNAQDLFALFDDTLVQLLGAIK